MQNIIVYIIIALAVVYCIVAAIRVVTRADKGGSGCSSGSCDGCSCRSNKEESDGGCGCS